MAIDFNLEKFYLGTLCCHGHEWKNTGKSLRYRCGQKHPCVVCIKEKNKKRHYKGHNHLFEKYQSLNEEHSHKFADNVALGALCKRGHNWNGSGCSLRYRSTYKCQMCFNSPVVSWKRNRFELSEEDRKQYEDAKNPEEWRRIEDSSLDFIYFISSWGNVRKWDEKTQSWFVLARHSCKGYPRVTLKFEHKRIKKMVHVLQAFAFLGDPPNENMVVMHKNNNRSGSFPCNLQWGTQKENMQELAVRFKGMTRIRYKEGPIPMERKKIPGFSGYEATSCGEIVSFRKYKDGRILKGSSISGYRTVGVVDEKGKIKTARVHRLVVLSFLGPPPEGKPFVLHADDDPLNNKLENLRWGSRVENSQDAIKNGNGRNMRRSINGNSRLSREQVVKIQKELKEGISKVDLAHKHTISASTIDAIASGYIWKHLL